MFQRIIPKYCHSKLPTTKIIKRNFGFSLLVDDFLFLCKAASRYLKLSGVIGGTIFSVNVVNGTRLMSYNIPKVDGRPQYDLKKNFQDVAYTWGVSLLKGFNYGIFWPVTMPWVAYSMMFNDPSSHFYPDYRVKKDEYEKMKKWMSEKK